MTAKDKAKELVSKFNFEHLGDRYILHQTVEESKRCALIAIDEAMLMLPYTDINTTLGKFCINQHEYLEQVRHEIKKL